MDPNLLKTVEGIAKIKASQKARFASEGVVDWLIELQKRMLAMKLEIEAGRKEVNGIIGEMKLMYKNKKKDGLDEEKLAALKSKKAILEVSVEKESAVQIEIVKVFNQQLNLLGNLVDKKVPISNDEEDNEIIKTVGDMKAKDQAPLHHSEVMYRLNCLNMEAGSVVAGNRSYFLTNCAVTLNLALIQYGLEFLQNYDYEAISTPLFMNKSVMGKTAQLSDYDEQLYKCSGSGEEKYLIATSEQPLSAYFYSTNATPSFIPVEKFPIRLGGFSTCFRKEAGNGADLRGIFRVHQFEKIEQFVMTKPEDSEKEHERMLKISEEFYQSLGLSYQVIAIVSGALNDAASIKYDLEAFFPNTQTFRELVSCSNCTDFQSRKLDIKYGYNNQEEKAPFCHMLNSTLVATERTLCCIMENYQSEEGLVIPEVLRKYCGGKELFPYKREKKVEEKVVAQKKKGGKKKGGK